MEQDMISKDSALAIFTFSPVQSFISEARRAEDLFNGSVILSRLASAAAAALGEQNLIYPASLSGQDMPNKLVAALPLDEAESKLQAAENALIGEWRKIAAAARQAANLDSDEAWMNIWRRQVIQNPPWQVFWVYVPHSGNYAQDYDEASRRLDALKHTRIFAQSEEDGEKDSLSGQRSALHVAEKTARAYWAEMAKKPHITAAKLKPEGKERLDSIGLVKRFAELNAGLPFPSTSTVAAWDFYQMARQNASDELQAYRDQLERLGLHKARKHDVEFPYDLDVLFKETLTPQRMRESYQRAEKDLSAAKNALASLVKKVGSEPSPYYAIVLLDGDGIGKKLDKKAVEQFGGKSYHQRFSQALAQFAQATLNLVQAERGGFLIYNGGDDVLLLASLQNAIPLARQLASAYRQSFNGWLTATLSGAVLIAHHLSPLSRALSDLRAAERAAKSAEADEYGNKDMLCVALTKRGGEPLLARSPWSALDGFEDRWAQPFGKGWLANSLPYLLRDDLRVAENLDQAAVRALARYRFRRQAGDGFKEKAAELAEQWVKWAGEIEKKLSQRDSTRRQAIEEAVHWLVIARFLGQGGKE